VLQLCTVNRSYCRCARHVCSQDVKMKKMASMQVYMASDPASRQALDRQMITWDENLEKLHVEQYQLRCYLAALQAADLPSTKARDIDCRLHSFTHCHCVDVIVPGMCTRPSESRPRRDVAASETLAETSKLPRPSSTSRRDVFRDVW